MKDSAVIKSLAEVGVDVTPKKLSPDIQRVLDRLDDYEKELTKSLDPKLLAKYLG